MQAKKLKEEVDHYKGKIKRYRNEVLELRDGLHSMQSKYVKVCNERDKYKQKISDTKEDIARFNELVEKTSLQKSEKLAKDLKTTKKHLREKDTQLSEKLDENKQLKNQMDEQNIYVEELEARITELLSDQKESEEEIKVSTPEKMPKFSSRIEMVSKVDSGDDLDVIITTKDSSQKKQDKIRQEYEYPSDAFTDIMVTPPTKKYQKNSRIADIAEIEKLKKLKENSLRSSLPACLRDNSYFDNQEQWRVLLDDRKAATYEKDPNKRNI